MGASILMVVVFVAAAASPLASARSVASGYGLPALAVITVIIAFPLWIAAQFQARLHASTRRP